MTMLCWFLLYNKGNQPYVYRYPLHLEPPFRPGPLHPSRSAQSTKLSSLRYTVGAHWLSVLHMAVHICQSQSAKSSHSPPLPSPHVHSLHLYLYFCPSNRFICTIFLDSTYIHQYMILVFHFLTYFTCMTDSRSICISTNDPVSFLFIAE